MKAYTVNNACNRAITPLWTSISGVTFLCTLTKRLNFHVTNASVLHFALNPRLT